MCVSGPQVVEKVPRINIPSFSACLRPASSSSSSWFITSVKDKREQCVTIQGASELFPLSLYTTKGVGPLIYDYSSIGIRDLYPKQASTGYLVHKKE